MAEDMNGKRRPIPPKAAKASRRRPLFFLLAAAPAAALTAVLAAAFAFSAPDGAAGKSGSVIAARSAGEIGPGASGADVFAMQAMLQSLGFHGGAIDGHYGPETARSVRKYQQSAGLAATGRIDGATFRSILAAYEQTAALPSFSEDEQNGLSKSEREMIRLVNEARAANGLAPLTPHAALSRAARLKSEDMAANGYFSHESPTYGSPFQMMSDFGIAYASAGENIACNRSVEAAHEALMNSPGHRANVLNADFTHIGVGIAEGGPCGAMFTQMFLRPQPGFADGA